MGKPQVIRPSGGPGDSGQRHWEQLPASFVAQIPANENSRLPWCTIICCSYVFVRKQSHTRGRNIYRAKGMLLQALRGARPPWVMVTRPRGGRAGGGRRTPMHHKQTWHAQTWIEPNEEQPTQKPKCPRSLGPARLAGSSRQGQRACGSGGAARAAGGVGGRNHARLRRPPTATAAATAAAHQPQL